MRYGQSVMNRPECGVERTLMIIGGKWTTLILRELLAGTRRFSELRRALGRVSPKTLTERLRHLETEGILTRTVYPEVPVRVEYTLTERGESLGGIIAAMAHWGAVDTPSTVAQYPVDAHAGP
ncbi:MULTISPECIES: helix-turn-helix domain-containing protein [unclassified Deinococcus]|uniref:winged helix-turn-helix transcriptional regulator n=1 Tax=unclassified Deinococcus TaxID=2623546 RepID=UPI001E51D32E